MATQQQPSVGLTSSQFAPGGFTTSTSSQLSNPFTPNLIPPISQITLTEIMQDLANDTTFQKLSLISDNYPIWCERLHSVLAMSGLDGYVDGTVLVPSSPSISQPDADSFWNYEANCRMIIAYLKCYIDDTELAHIGTIDNPHTLWVSLANRHNKRGALPVIRLLKTLFGYQFSADTSAMASTLQNMRATNARVFAHSALTKDSLLICCILHALEANHDHIRSAASSHYTSYPDAGPEWLFDRIAAEMQFKSPVPGAAETVSAAAQVICENKKCGKTGHRKDSCYQPGGGMEGRRSEVRRMVREKNRREGKPTRSGRGYSGPSARHPFMKTADGRTFIIDSDTHQAVFLAAPDVPAPNFSSPTASSSLTTDPSPWDLSPSVSTPTDPTPVAPEPPRQTSRAPAPSARVEARSILDIPAVASAMAEARAIGARAREAIAASRGRSGSRDRQNAGSTNVCLLSSARHDTLDSWVSLTPTILPVRSHQPSQVEVPEPAATYHVSST